MTNVHFKLFSAFLLYEIGQQITGAPEKCDRQIERFAQISLLFFWHNISKVCQAENNGTLMVKGPVNREMS